ncbi:MAG: Multidrug resistance protein MdtC [Chlamydiales bacterium]|nr:Multidrug resistance protein MdtC [Chlamydiales bacterium]MCH9620373.1 Multidrug resistance protein MdtC [Chlamydiales bacterium]MCH9622981.1 Multidrug resistance protein MdtC [Chlamydiales bacterium]
MSFSTPFIKRPVMTTMLMLSIVVFGIYTFLNLPVSDLPNIEYPTITVSASLPGASPDYIASSVAAPLEKNLVTIPGLNSMRSSNYQGGTSITLNFDLNVDLNEKEIAVQGAINSSLGYLASLEFPPTYSRVNPAASPILYFILSSQTASYPDLYTFADDILSKPLSMIRGVGKADVLGDEFAIRVKGDPLRMAGYNLDFVELGNVLINSSPNLPGGEIHGDFTNFIIQSIGQLSSVEEYQNIVVKETGDFPLFVSNVAKVEASSVSRNPFYKFYSPDGTIENIALISITRRMESNTIQISQGVMERLDRLKSAIPNSMNFNILFDRAFGIGQTVRDIEITLLLALFLVIAVIFFYLGKFTEAIIPSLVLPMSMLCTFIAMYFMHYSLDSMSLLALTLAIGFIVDDAIVVTENIVRHAEMGMSPYEAAMAGSKQISTTVISMVIALSAIFIPFIWMPGIIGRILREFSITLVVAIYCSGFIALTLIPLLCSRFLHHKRGEKTWVQRLNDKVTHGYVKSLEFAFRWKKMVCLAGFSCFLVAYWVFTLLSLDFIPESNISFLTGTCITHDGSSKVNTINHSKKVFERLAKLPYHNGVTALAGVPSDSFSTFYINLADASDRPRAGKIAEDMMEAVKDIPGISTYITPYPIFNLAIGTSLGSFQYVLYSLDEKTLPGMVKKMTDGMKKLPGFKSVYSDLHAKNPKLEVYINRDQAGWYNITPNQVETTLEHAYSGGAIAQFPKGGHLYNLILETDPRFNLLTSDLDLLYIKGTELNVTTSTGTISSSAAGNMVPISSVAYWKETVGPSSVSHFNSFPSSTISFSLEDGYALPDALKAIEKLKSEILPENILGSIEGTGKAFLDTFKAIGLLTLFAVVIIYLILGILYESFLHPFTILSALPPAAMGGVLTLLVFHQPLSLYGAIGMIVLIGIVQKNGIMMIDFALEQLREGKEAKEAMLEACRARFRPIIMTTLAAMAAALPVAIGIGPQGYVNRPLGLVVVGGLLVSQIITLYFTPVIFLFMQQISRYFAKRKGSPSLE